MSQQLDGSTVSEEATIRIRVSLQRYRKCQEISSASAAARHEPARAEFFDKHLFHEALKQKDVPRASQLTSLPAEL
jgi:hypothetical protein